MGEEIGVPTNNRITDQNTTFQTYEYKTVGIKLKITPHITKKQRITPDLYQEVNSIIGETQQLSGGTLVPPKLGKRDIKTKVTVHDGKTIVVGGLISNKKDTAVSKVPAPRRYPGARMALQAEICHYKKTNPSRLYHPAHRHQAGQARIAYQAEDGNPEKTERKVTDGEDKDQLPGGRSSSNAR